MFTFPSTYCATFSLRLLAVSTAMYFCVAASQANIPASQPQNDTAVIVLLVEDFNKTTDQQTKEKYKDQLKANHYNWDAMFLAACQIGEGRNEVLIPILASGGKSVVPQTIQMLTMNSSNTLDTAIKVTREVGSGAIRDLMGQYKDSSAILIKRYIAISVKDILAKKDENKYDSNELLQWAMKLSAEKDVVVVASSLKIMQIFFTEINSGKIEPILKEKLKDTQPGIRTAAIDVLTQVKPKADYVKKHVVGRSMVSIDRLERDTNIRLCARLPESNDVLDTLYECAFDKDGQMRNAAAQTLGVLGPKSLPLAGKMLKKLQAGSVDSLPAILMVLKHSQEEWDAIECALVKILGNEKTNNRGLCLDFLGNHSSLKDSTIQKMAELLDDSDKYVRILAIRALHPFGQKQFVRDAIAKRRNREGDASVKKLLDMFMAELQQGAKPQ